MAEELPFAPRPRLSDAGVQTQLMFLNEPFTGDYFVGQRPSGFFNSIGRQFVLQGGTVLDHWKGVADESPDITPAEFDDMRGSRDLPMPEGRVTRNMAQRLISRHDRELREQQFESNWRSVTGGLVGGVVPWIGSPEGLVGFLVPPVRVRQATSAVRTIESQTGSAIGTTAPSRASIVLREASAQIPAAAVMGGTNILAQQAAYGDVDALEAALVIGAPIALGAGVGVFRRNKIKSAEAKRAAATMSDTTPPAQVASAPVETVVPSRLLNSFARWAGIEAGDTAATVFEKIVRQMQARNMPREVMDNLIEAFARTGTRQIETSVNPNVRQAIKNLTEADATPVSKVAPEVRAQAQNLDRRIAETERRLEKAQRELAKQSKPDLIFSGKKTPAKRMPAKRTAAQKKAIVEVKKHQKELARLQAARAGVPDRDALGVSMVEKENLVRQRIAELADVLARETDHPLPAEFVAEFMELAGLTAKVSRDVVRSPRTSVENPDAPTVTATTTREQTVLDEIANDPAFKKLVEAEGGEAAMRNFTRVENILKGCPV